MQELSGTRIDRYTIQEEIGRGGMSRVYRAQQSGLGRDVALKVLLPEITGDEVSVARFLREARAAAKLDHPNIVPIYDTGQADGSYFIAMKLIEGKTLRALLGEREVDVPEVGGYLTQVASALDYAHERGIVHRDIKPENIMVEPGGKVILTDFGIANLIDEMSVTTTGAVIGTPVYMAPEQLRGEPATPRSDIYALGVLVYELLSGASPFAGRTPYAVMLAQIDEQPKPVQQRRADVPAAAAVAVDRALAKDPAQRHVSAGDFADQFAGALDGDGRVWPAPIIAAGLLTSGTTAATVRSTAPTLARRSSTEPTLVSSAAAVPERPVPTLRSPWFASLVGAGLVLAVVFAGMALLRDGEDSAAQDNNPAVLPLIETATPDAPAMNTPVIEVAAPADEAQPAVEPMPTEVVEVQPPVSPPTEVIEEPLPTTPPDDEDDPERQEDPDDGPGGPANKPEKPERGNDDDDEERDEEDRDENREDDDDDDDD